MDYHAARSGHSSPSLPLPLSSLHHLHQHHHNQHNSHHHQAQHHLMGLSQASAPSLLPPPSSPSHPHAGLFYYPGLAVGSKTPAGPSSSSSSLISASSSSSKLHVGNGTLHRREKTLAVPPIPHPIALPPQPQQSSPHQAHLSLVTPGSSAEVSPPSGSSSRSNNNNGSGASVSGGSSGSSSSFAAALRHLAKQAGGPSGGSTSTAPPHVTPNNSDAEGESLRSPSRNYGPVSGPGPGGGGTSNGGPSYPFLSSQSSNNGSTSAEGSNRSSSSGAAGQARVKSSSPNEPSSSRSAGSGHRTNGGGVRNSDTTAAASSDGGATKSSRQAHDRERDSGATNAVITRSRSPPVVTIAPTLSLTGLHYQDSRKTFERGPSSLAHAVPSSGATFGGGLSTGLSGLSAPLTTLGASSLAGLVSTSGIGVPYSVASAASAMAMGTSAPGPTSGFGIRTPDSLHPAAPTFHHALPSPFNPFQHSPRPEDVFYGGLRSVSGTGTGVQIPTSTCHFRPEDNPLAMIPPPHGLSLGINSSYHESLLAQLPSSRASTLTPQQQQEEQYLMAARSSTYNPYSLPGVDHHSALYHHPSFASASPYRLEEQLYLERYGLLRPSAASLAAPHGGISPYPPLPFANPYLNFRYPSPLLHTSAEASFAAGNLDSNLNRMKMEEELRLKERLREEERLTTPVSSKSQDSSVSNRPLATVPPRESCSSSSSSTSSSLQHSQRSQERKDKDRSRERDRDREREREKDKAREKERERDKQRRAEREVHESELSRCPSESALANSQMKSNRKLTVNLPSESTAVRGVKVHAVSPLSYSSAVHEPTSATMATSTSIDIDKVEETAAQRPEEAVPTAAAANDRTRPAHTVIPADHNEIKGHAEFSYSALEAMAMLRHRITSPVVPVAAVAAVSAQATEPMAVFDQDKGPGDSIPLDLSDSSTVARIDESRQVQQQQQQQQQLQPPASPPPAPAQAAVGYPFSSEACVTEIRADRVTSDQEQVRSVLDLRVERWRLKREKHRKADQADNGVSDVEDVDDLDEEVSQLNLGLPLNLGSSSPSLKSEAAHRWPSVISEEQLNFLCLFGLITPQQRNDCELMKCMKRHSILRDPTPTPILETNDEDSATQLLKQRTTLARAHCSQQLPDDVSVKDEQEVPCESQVHFARSLALLPRDPSDKRGLEVSWKAVVADRTRRYFGRRDFVRKRLRNEAFRPIEVANGDENKPNSEIDDPCCKKSRHSESSVSPVSSTSDSSDQLPMVNGINKQPKNGFVHPHSAVPICQVPSLAKLDLLERPNDWCNEASKLTSEVAFWLRHLTIPMARTLTSSSFKESSTSSIPVAIPKVNAVRYSEEDEDNEDEDESEDDGPFMGPTPMMKWPGVDNLMVLYMASQQEYSNETKFLREHCERLHVQLAEGQATLSKLCLSLSSLVETQRKFKEEESLALQSISQLQTTLNMLHQPYK